MSAKDLFHQAVRIALEKESWLITADPLRLSLGSFNFYIDLGAEEIIAAENNQRKIAVEIKSFIAASTVNEFHAALGQFLNYKLALEITDSQRVLYLAVPEDIHKSFFQLEFPKMAAQRYQLKLIIYNAETEVIVQWIE